MTGRFEGDLSSAAAWEKMAEDRHAVLVDVRTAPEWEFVGIPDLSTLGRSVIKASWQIWPTMTRNANFLAEVTGAGVAPGRSVFLICRSGIRSRAAALLLAEHGLTTHNLSDGFEGPLGPEGHRGHAGWRAAGLPWRQG